MNTDSILHYATVVSMLIGAISVAVAFFIHRETVKTQIFLTLSARYDELLQSGSSGMWLSMPGNTIPPRREDLTTWVLRFCTLLSLTYYLFREGRIPKPMWK